MIPAAYSALTVTREVFEGGAIGVTLTETFDPSVAPETLYKRGIENAKIYARRLRLPSDGADLGGARPGRANAKALSRLDAR